MNPRTSDIFLFSPAYESRTEVELEFYLQKTEQTDISLNLQNSSFFFVKSDRDRKCVAWRSFILLRLVSGIRRNHSLENT